MSKATELEEKYAKYKTEQQQCFEKLATFCKTLVPLLEDKGMPAMAKELGAQLFHLEAIETDMKESMTQDPAVFLEFIQAAFGRRK